MSSRQLLIHVSNHQEYRPYCIFLYAHSHIPYYCRMEAAVQKIEKKQCTTRLWTNTYGVYVATHMTIEEDCKMVLLQLHLDISERALLCDLIRMYSGNWVAFNNQKNFCFVGPVAYTHRLGILTSPYCQRNVMLQYIEMVIQDYCPRLNATIRWRSVFISMFISLWPLAQTFSLQLACLQWKKTMCLRRICEIGDSARWHAHWFNLRSCVWNWVTA